MADPGSVGPVADPARPAPRRDERAAVGPSRQDDAGRDLAASEVVVPWSRAVRDVAVAAGLVVGGILGLVVLTSLLPVQLQWLVFHTPLTIVILIAGTAWLLWSIGRRRAS